MEHNTVIESQQSSEAAGARLIADLSAALTEIGAIATQGYPADDTDLLVAEGVRHVTRLTSSCALVIMEGDPAYPYLVKLESIERQYGLPGVDCVYHYAPFHGDYRYGLRGNSGATRIFEIEIWSGHISNLREWKFFATTSRSIAPGEDLNIRFSREKQAGDWVELPEGDCCILIRQYYYDWDTEKPAYLFVEREGAIYPPPQLTLAEAGKRMGQVTTWMRETAQAARHVIQQYLDADPSQLAVVHLPFGFTKLRYLRGHYRCKPDQAVILEVKPPKAKYWNFQLGNVQWEALDYHLRMTAINGHQAVLDADGVFRAVISHVDPGVANWLDTSGRMLGMISGRYYDPETAPAPTLRTVPLASLDEHLPKDTRRVTPQERQAVLRSRMLSTVRRQCGD